MFHGLGPATQGGSPQCVPQQQAGIVISDIVPVPQEGSVFSGYGPVPQGGSPRYVPKPQRLTRFGLRRSMGLGGVAGGVAGGGLGECVNTLSLSEVRLSNAVSLSPVNIVQLSTLEQVQPGEGEACCTP